jgi:nitroimidazol reductase NimA-like FMN-containing flavoprotein (pyridoxamine 5'-phosphate oxidase superfamily)
MSEPVELSGNQCLELLQTHGVGRVAFGTPMGPRIVPVRYTLRGGEIIFRVAPYSEAGTYAPNTEVAFEIDDVDATGHCGCMVVALGRAEIVEEAETPDGGGDGGQNGEHSRSIKVRAHDFTGLRVSD